tara:strand:- start:575 stop:1300 length:726 start_codon:yes stop_codon:yes gene_type:complete
MNLKSLNIKLVIGTIYLCVILTGLYFLFSFIDVKDLMSYEFIRANKDIILKYKNENFLFLSVTFFIFSILWVLLLGFLVPLLLFAGFVFGKWWGIIIVLSSTTIGATLLYVMVGFFFRDFVQEKLKKKFEKLKEHFVKNDILYFMSFRFIGGGGAPYSVQNVIPIIFNMNVKNYFIATLLGSMPSMFVTVALGSGIQNIIDKNAELSFSKVLLSPEIYIPIIIFFIILLFAVGVKKIYFKE